jgi:hypothetical protein
MSKSVVNFLQALLAVLVGNAFYFLLEKYLPVWAHHSVFRLDLGMLVDFGFCLAALGIIKNVAGPKPPLL